MKNTRESAHLGVYALACRRGGRLLFENLGWQAAAGTAVSVRGPNGAGKTSLLRLVAGLGLPDSGEVRWRGASIAERRAAYNGSVAWVGHADGIKGDLSPRENLAFHRALQRIPGVTVDAALDELGLAVAADIPCRRLSAGQRRRAALARLRVATASLWILDEPLAALDVEGQQVVDTLLARHLADGGIAVVTSHQPLAAAAGGIEVVLG